MSDVSSPKKRLENSFMAVVVGVALAASAVAYKTTTWFHAQTMTLTEQQHKQAMNVAIADVRSELEPQIEELVLDNLTLQRLIGAGLTPASCAAGESQACKRLDVSRKIGHVADPDTVLQPGRIDAYFGNRIFAPSRGAVGGQVFSVVREDRLRFLYDAKFQPEGTQPADNDSLAQFWLLDRQQVVHNHALFKRFAPYVVAYRMPLTDDEMASQMNSDRRTWEVFQRDFREKFDSVERLSAALGVKLKLKIRRIEKEGDILFVHFMTRVSNVEIDGVVHDRIFLNEFQFVTPIGNEIYVLKSVFTSEGPQHRQSPDWVKVLDWWDKLQINSNVSLHHG